MTAKEDCQFDSGEQMEPVKVKKLDIYMFVCYIYIIGAFAVLQIKRAQSCEIIVSSVVYEGRGV